MSAIVSTLRAAGCVFAEDEAHLLMEAATSESELATMVDRRAAGEPLEHVLGWAEFCGLRIAIDPGVFVPRRRTEFLVARAVELVRLTPPTPVVLDLCCGSGAVGAALAAAVPGLELYAADIDPAAVRCARRNVSRVYEGDLFDPLPLSLRGRVDVVVANTPYVPTTEIRLLPPEARLHEPRVALDGGADGLDTYRRVAAATPEWLAPGGHLLVETSESQAAAATAIATAAGLKPELASDGETTVLVATYGNDFVVNGRGVS